MGSWINFPHAPAHPWDAISLQAHWARLHRGDCEPWPQNPAVVAAWVLFHNGAFEQAAEAGRKAGAAGCTVANKATAIYANYLEPKEKTKLDLFLQVAEQAEAQQIAEPGNPAAWYWQAYSLGRYSQGISVAKALAQGFGSKVKAALERTVALQPQHADAHTALGTFHAEVIDKVGALIGGMTYGAKKDVGLHHFQTALQLNPSAAIVMIEYANGLVMLEGDSRMQEANEFYEKAAACEPLDAQEQLDVDMAREALENE